jgi:hypothetical protein
MIIGSSWEMIDCLFRKPKVTLESNPFAAGTVSLNDLRNKKEI